MRVNNDQIMNTVVLLVSHMCQIKKCSFPRHSFITSGLYSQNSQLGSLRLLNAGSSKERDQGTDKPGRPHINILSIGTLSLPL